MKVKYVDGFVLIVPTKNLAQYKKVAKKAGAIWKKYGALDYKECLGDDLNMTFGLPFTKLTRAKAGETVVFSWIGYRSKAHRNSVNKKVMADPWIKSMENCPFDVKRMSYGGFKVLVDAGI